MTANDCARSLYIDLLLKCVAGTIYGDANMSPWSPKAYDPALREVGRDWPSTAHSMIGLKRLQNLRDSVETVIRGRIPGDLIETSVWRGGACILIRGILKAHAIADRTVYVADSFAGLPPPDDKTYPHDAGDKHHRFGELAVPLEQVQAAFRAYGLLDGQVAFLKGWFKDTLATLGERRFALIRLDGDMYESTIQALDALYPRLSRGGIAIIDDYGAIRACRQAVDEFRARHAIVEPLVEIDWSGRWWRKA